MKTMDKLRTIAFSAMLCTCVLTTSANSEVIMEYSHSDRSKLELFLLQERIQLRNLKQKEYRLRHVSNVRYIREQIDLKQKQIDILQRELNKFPTPTSLPDVPEIK